ncbi:MAG TPA: protein-disulfide reductase DsbD domain-containing protein [Pyrinomonadaceae bacterium]|nr:protein-disulfide reductase DsbD domain-containing protein [Pyrinomonadaceae bacterium]
MLLILGLLAVSCSKSPATNTETPGAIANEPPRIASTDVVKATPQEATLARGESGDVLVSLKIADGYHVNANPPSFSYLKPTELEIQPADGIAVEFMRYPDPLTKKFSFADKPLAVYEGETTLTARLKVDHAVQTGKHNLFAKLRVQACDDKVCYAPGALDLKVPVNIK